MTTQTIDDTITAEIGSIDLYSLIYPVKEQHFADYGRIWNDNYEKKMLALIDRKPQQRLQHDRIAREVVKAILTTKDCFGADLSLATIEGNNPIMRTVGATVFPNVSDDDVQKRLYALKNDGLLDVIFGGCGMQAIGVLKVK